MAPEPSSDTALTGRRVVVIGGGLAGLAAAVRLAEAGLSPLLLERRPFLGGRAYSFVDRDTGVEVDNGQHVFVGACFEYKEFLDRIGASSNAHIPERLDAPALRQGKLSRLKAAAVPGPFANLKALLGYGHLSVGAKLRMLYGMARMRLASRGPGGPLENENFDSWLRRHGQNDETIENFWNLITLPALNDDVTEVSADMGLMLFVTALMGDPEKAAIGYPAVGLSSLAGVAAAEFIEAHGGEVRCATAALSVGFDDGRVEVQTADGGIIHARACVSALMPGALLGILPEDLRAGPFFSGAAGIQTAPIVGVHVWYDRPVMDEKFVAVIDSPLQWVFNVTDMHGDDDRGGQHIVISLSGAWRWKDTPKAELREIFEREMARQFAAASSATVTRFLVVKMLDATFRVVPGSAQYRLPQKSPQPGFFLAGDWTDTGWPSTMESAVMSGNRAAGLAIDYLKEKS